MMTDLIRRQDAIDAVEFGITYAKAFNVNTGESNKLFEEGNEALKKAVERLKELSSAESEQRWILCSERLPEKDGEYLVESTRGYEVLYYREKEKQFGLMVYNFAGKVGFVPKKVYEWMPIPGVEE